MMMRRMMMTPIQPKEGIVTSNCVFSASKSSGTKLERFLAALCQAMFQVWPAAPQR